MSETALAETLDRFSPGEAASWAAAGVLVLGLHAAGFWLAQNMAAEPSGGPAEAVMIELAPMPTAPEPIAAPNPILEELAEPPQIEPEPVEEVVEAEPVEAPEPPEEMRELLEAPPEIETPPEVVEAPPIELPEPPVETQQLDAPPVIEPQLVEAVTPEVDIPLPSPRPEPPKREVAEKAPPKKQARKAPPERSAARQQAARAEKPAAPKAQPPAERRTARVSPARWQARIKSYLERHKRYPRGARSRQEEGTVQLSFAIDRSGRVLSASVARSSGYPELDAEVLAMIRRASPLPPPPDAIARARMQLMVPVDFSLR